MSLIGQKISHVNDIGPKWKRADSVPGRQTGQAWNTVDANQIIQHHFRICSCLRVGNQFQTSANIHNLKLKHPTLPPSKSWPFICVVIIHFLCHYRYICYSIFLTVARKLKNVAATCFMMFVENPGSRIHKSLNGSQKIFISRLWAQDFSCQTSVRFCISSQGWEWFPMLVTEIFTSMKML